MRPGWLAAVALTSAAFALSLQGQAGPVIQVGVLQSWPHAVALDAGDSPGRKRTLQIRTRQGSQ